MIHRVVLGAIDRFLGVLIEHVGGKFPVWLAPVQVKVLTITEKEIPFAKEIYDKMKSENIRVELDSENEMLGYKVRKAQLEKVPYMVIIGKKEAEKGLLTIRKRNGENLKNLSLENFISMIKEEVAKRK